MKRIKDRPMTIVLMRQLTQQDKRIKDAALFALLGKYVLTTKGTFYSNREGRTEVTQYNSL